METSRQMNICDRVETEKLLSFTLAGIVTPNAAAIHWERALSLLAESRSASPRRLLPERRCWRSNQDNQTRRQPL